MALNFAIDGGVATGGSTLAKNVAREFGFEIIPTSQTYRGLSLLMAREGHAATDVTEAYIVDFLLENKGRLALTSAGIEIDNENCSVEAGQEIHGRGASIVSAIQTVRDEYGNPAVLACTANSPVNTVSEGRNEFRLFSGADKLLAGVYLHASAESRIQRFRKEAARRLNKSPEVITDQEIAVMILERDLSDMKRTTEPLIPHENALELDYRSAEGMSELVQAVRARRQVKIDTGPRHMTADRVFQVASTMIDVALRT
ncbi:(d)CMP kinase [Candidatus Saccharibacteria bacterium]|nr:(d)CMP kinase [Candidatus Saccharibacteria bacterium]